MKKLLFIPLFFLFFLSTVNAQDFPVNAWTQKEMEMTSYNKDTSAHALVLDEHGDSKLDVVVDGDEHIRLVYRYHIKIKIFDELGFKHGTVEIPLYNNDQSAENVSDITGFTVFKDNIGGYKTENLNPEKIYRVKENKNHTMVKFALPAVSKGCIIEYSYTKTSPYFEDFHDWPFQSDIPKLHSDYDAHIPGFWTYNISIRGGLKLKKQTVDLERACFSNHGALCDCSHLVFGLDSIPAFTEESYMTAPRNFMSAIYFELSEYTNPYTGAHVKMAKQWSDVDYQLKHDDSFGGQIKRKELLKDRIPPVIGLMTDDLEKAKAIYAYIQKVIKWNGRYAFFSFDGIKKALDKHAGNVGEVNLSLVAALNAMGLNAEAVLLSTRENGIINRLYPVITEFNYVIAKVNIGDKSYLLDATDPLLAFGMLPLRCLNDQGRVMSLNKPSYWVDMTTPQNESKTYIADLKLQDDGKLKGTVSIFSKGYAAYKTRKAIKEFNTIDEYVENLDERLPKIKIIKSNITNLDTLNSPISEVYEVEMDAFKGLHNKLDFNPYIFEKIQTNPFKLAERVFPVDWGMPSETRFILNVHLPDGYTIENPPENVSIGLPNQGGSFMVNYQPATNSFVFSHIISLKKSIYSSEEYPYLKELYNKIILSEKAEMVFVKN